MESPFPYELRSDLLAERDWTEPVLSDTPLVEGAGRTGVGGGAVAAGNGGGEQ